MPQHDIRSAVRNRDNGMAKITALSWRAGAAGVAVAGLLTVALGHQPGCPHCPGGAPRRPQRHRDPGSAAEPGTRHRPGNVWRVMTAGAR
ncbi:MAG TPA: hypothetical protein VNW50_16430 [Streptosporangiaceae bacterium]|nr:hypothetical protein [Streptosporangiaceae bacterium]